MVSTLPKSFLAPTLKNDPLMASRLEQFLEVFAEWGEGGTTTYITSKNQELAKFEKVGAAPDETVVDVINSSGNTNTQSCAHIFRVIRNDYYRKRPSSTHRIWRALVVKKPVVY